MSGGTEITLVALILERSQGYDVHEIGKLLAQQEDILLADATSRVRYSRGLLLKGVLEEEAQKLQQQLEELEEKSLIIPMDKYVSSLPIYHVGRAHPKEEGLEIQLSGYKKQLLQWEKIEALNFVSLNQILSEEEEAKRPSVFFVSKEQEISPLSQAIMENLEYWKRKSYHLELFFDIVYQEGPSIYRFHYKSLSYPEELQVYSYSLDNFLHLFRLVAESLPEEKHTETTSAFLRHIETLEQASEEERKKNIDRPRLLDDTIFYKLEELQNYNEWLVHAWRIHERAIPVESKKDSDLESLSSSPEKKSSGWDLASLRIPVILGGLGVFYGPMALYIYATYVHSQGKPALSLDMAFVQQVFLGLGAVGTVVLLLGHRFKGWSLGYLVALWLTLLSAWAFYPLVLAKSGELRIQAIEQKKKLLLEIQSFFRQHKRYPRDLKELFGREVKDPWGRPWVYELRSPKGPYTLFSLGGDGQRNTEDDI